MQRRNPTAVPSYAPAHDVAAGQAVRSACPAAVAVRGGRVVRALGTAVAPRTETIVISRGTHRTRVSEMRLAAARAAAPRPDVSDVVVTDRHAAIERNGGAQVRDGTG
jgi:uncharacterized protein YcgI (DUF1989 family)